VRSVAMGSRHCRSNPPGTDSHPGLMSGLQTSHSELGLFDNANSKSWRELVILSIVYFAGRHGFDQIQGLNHKLNRA